MIFEILPEGIRSRLESALYQYYLSKGNTDPDYAPDTYEEYQAYKNEFGTAPGDMITMVIDGKSQPVTVIDIEDRLVVVETIYGNRRRIEPSRGFM